MHAKQLSFIILLLFIFGLSSCARKSSSAFQMAKEQQQQQEYLSAIANYTKTISGQQDEQLAAVAHFYRGQCYEGTENFSEAYRDFYAATKLSCRFVSTNKAGNTRPTAMGVLAQSALCDDYGPKAMQRAQAQLSDTETQEIRSKVDSELSTN